MENKRCTINKKNCSYVNGSKEDKVLLKKEFNTEKEAINFINVNFSNDYQYKFKLEKNAVEYSNDKLRVWVEEIKYMGTSIEIGSENPQEIENTIKLFDVKERLEESVPEYLYNKLLKKH